MGVCGVFWVGVWLYSSFCVFGYFSEFVHNFDPLLFFVWVLLLCYAYIVRFCVRFVKGCYRLCMMLSMAAISVRMSSQRRMLVTISKSSKEEYK